MKRNLPSPTALLAFEASARLLSLKHAASELNVSPAAVSRQIHNLEDYVGQPLFRRLHRRIELTEPGAKLFEPVNQGFAGMAAALAELKTDGEERQVTVGTSGGFAYYWLMPRLSRFSQAWPEITLNQIVSDEPIEMSSGPAELAVRYGAGRWPGLESRYLFSDHIYPVCSPSYLETVTTPLQIGDLADHPLYEVRGIEGDDWVTWAVWLRYAGHPSIGIRGRYLNYLIGVQLALEGQGFVLGWDSFIGDLVNDGQLVKPFDISVPSPGAFYLTYPSGRPLSSDSKLFVEWLIIEAASAESLTPK